MSSETFQLLKTSGLKLSDIDHFEVNEAFSCVVLAFIKSVSLFFNNSYFLFRWESIPLR